MVVEAELKPPFASGIYFNLPAELYHSDPAIGSTDLKILALDACDFQWQRLEKVNAEPEELHLKFGDALHTRLLEGKAAFNRRFYREFDESEYPNALKTVKDITEKLKDFDFKPKKGQVKADLIRELLGFDPTVEILDVLKADYDAKHEGKTPLPSELYRRVELSAEWARKDKYLEPFIDEDGVKVGANEVSVFVEIEGVRFKGRFDWLLPHMIVDFKSYSKRGQLKPKKHIIINAINRYRYDLQEALYRREWRHLKEAYDAGTLQVFGEPPHPDFIRQCFDRDDVAWAWLFIASDDAPTSMVLPWNAHFAQAASEDKVEAAIKKYLHFAGQYGEHEYWPPEDVAEEIVDTDLPAYFGE